jgi:hypothetical protein
MIKILFFTLILLIIIFLDLYSNNIENKIEIIKIKKNDENLKKKYNNINERFIDDLGINNNNNKIWSKIIDDKYYIKIKPLNLIDYTNWKDYIDGTNIVNDIYFDPNINELIITSDNEDNAIIIAYYILNNFKGVNNFEDSIILLNNNINRVRDDDNFKNSLIDNIYDNLNQIKKNNKDNMINQQINLNTEKKFKKSKENLTDYHKNLESSENLNNFEDSKSYKNNNNIDLKNNESLDFEAFNDDFESIENANFSFI